MFNIDTVDKIYLSPQPIDFRKGIHSFAALVSTIKLDETKKYIFIFASKSNKAIKIFYKDKTGYWLCIKVLDEGRFMWPRNAEEALYISKEDLIWLLSGNKMIQAKRLQPMRYY